MGHAEKKGPSTWIVIAVTLLVCGVAFATAFGDVLELVRNW